MTELSRGLASLGIQLAQSAAPDSLTRWGMRRAIATRRRRESRRPDSERQAWLDHWHRGPIALETPAANDQHYEVETQLFEAMLGPRLKYSACLWDGAATLAEAEDDMLAETVEGAGVENGMRVLDLGCGWGSLSGYISERFPDCQVQAVSNSASQGRYIAGRYREVRHTVADVNDFDTDDRFDRVVSVEMVEHVRNHPKLFDRVQTWLDPDGSVFLHHFAHRRWFWPFEDDGPGDWMARRFFTGGIMPNHDYFPTVLDGWDTIHQRWFDGRHYSATLEAWLDRFDASDAAVPDRADWRWFLMACSELFDQGTDWGVTHIGLRPS